MSFTNLYYKRTTGTPKACYVCYKPTTTVLATINTTDFLYACLGHLTDPGFASAVGDSNDGLEGSRKLGLSQEEIAKVREEWEERQKKKKEKEKERAKDKETDKKSNPKDSEEKDKKESKAEEMKSGSVPGSWSSGPSTPAPTPTHQRFVLHRDFFAMRLSEHRKRRQATQAKQLAPRLPGAPRGGPIDSF